MVRGGILPRNDGPHGGTGSRQDAPPHFLFETSKRKCAAPGGKEKMLGGSVCACADLLPPAGDGWRPLAAVRDGNALPLGRPSARGGQRYIQLLFSLPLAWWLMWLLQRADEGIGPYDRQGSA